MAGRWCHLSEREAFIGAWGQPEVSRTQEPAWPIAEQGALHTDHLAPWASCSHFWGRTGFIFERENVSPTVRKAFLALKSVWGHFRGPFFMLKSLRKMRLGFLSSCTSLLRCRMAYWLHSFFLTFPKALEVSYCKPVAVFTVPSPQGPVSDPKVKNEFIKWQLVTCDRLSFRSDQVGVGAQSTTKNHAWVNRHPGNIFPPFWGPPRGSVRSLIAYRTWTMTGHQQLLSPRVQVPASQVSQPTCLYCKWGVNDLVAA